MGMRWLYEGLLDSALFFSFLSGALISLAGNLATGALLWTSGTPVSRPTLNWLSLFLTIASVGSFRASLALDVARRAWETDGKAKTERANYLDRWGKKGLFWGVGLMILGLGSALAIFLSIPTGLFQHGN